MSEEGTTNEDQSADQQVATIIDNLKAGDEKPAEEAHTEAAPTEDGDKGQEAAADSPQELTSEQMTEIATSTLRSRGYAVTFPGEEARVEAPQEKPKPKTAEQYLADANITDEEVPGYEEMDVEEQLRVSQVVISERQSAKAGKRAQEIAAEQTASIVNKIAMDVFRKDAAGIASAYAKEAGDEGAAQELTELIEEVGPGFRQAVQQSPLFADLIETRANSILAKRSGGTGKEPVTAKTVAEPAERSSGLGSSADRSAFEESGLADVLDYDKFVNGAEEELS